MKHCTHRADADMREHGKKNGHGKKTQLDLSVFSLYTHISSHATDIKVLINSVLQLLWTLDFALPGVQLHIMQ